MNIEELSYDQARETKAAIGELMDSKGWEFLKAFLEQRQKEFENGILSAFPRNMDAVVDLAHTRGRIDEIRGIPAILEQVYMDLDTWIKQVQDEEEAAQQEDLFDE